MPSTADVVTVRRDMMTMIETKTNDTMKTKNTMNDASKCVSLAPRLSRANSHAYARHQESRKRLSKTNPFQHPDVKDPDAHKTFDSRYVATLGGPSP